ncbi:MAG: ribonuclease P protein component [Chlamydiae bacterium]|nr:ribonuclease P protein component [Chlamydiota bacterium]
MSFSFSKADRLLKHKDFLRIFKTRKRVVGQVICIDYSPFSGKTKLGITVSKKFGSSVERNHFKRRIREAFRLNKPLLPGVEINISPSKKSKGATFHEINQELLSLLNKI